MTIRSSSFSPVYNTNPDTNNLLVEMVEGSNSGSIVTQRTTSILTTSTSGTIAIGARSIAIANIGAVMGTVKGVSIGAGIALTFDAPSADTLDAIAYNATDTTFLITEVR